MEKIVISIGGSLIVPGQIDAEFLEVFKKTLLDAPKHYKFVLVTGGGHTARIYQQAAKKLNIKASHDDLDWIGLVVNRMHSYFLKAVFGKTADRRILGFEERNYRLKKFITVALGGRLPGGSSDTTALFYAQKTRAKTVLNLTDVDGVYDRDPHKFKKAKLIPHMRWTQFIKKFGSSRKPGQHKPFDQSVAKEADKLGITVVIMNGRNMQNLRRFFYGQKFRGTVIS